MNPMAQAFLRTADLQDQMMRAYNSFLKEPDRDRESGDLPFETAEYGGWGGEEYLGIGEERLERPVVFSHGLGRDAESFISIANKLRQEGYSGKDIYSITYGELFPGLEEGAEQLEDFISKVREHTCSEAVDVVGHSIGGLIPRYMAEEHGNGGDIRVLVSLGAPHHGSIYNDFFRSFGLPRMDQISSRSASEGFLEDLNSGEEDFQIYAVSGDYDSSYPVNNRSSHLNGAVNVNLVEGHEGVKNAESAQELIMKALEVDGEDLFIEAVEEIDGASILEDQSV